MKMLCGVVTLVLKFPTASLIYVRQSLLDHLTSHTLSRATDRVVITTRLGNDDSSKGSSHATRCQSASREESRRENRFEHDDSFDGPSFKFHKQPQDQEKINTIDGAKNGM